MHALQKVRRTSPDSGFISRVMAEAISDLEPMIRGRVIDLGCGQKPLEAISRYATEWVGVDRSGHGVTIHDLRKPLPFHSESFDTAILTDVLEHVEDPELVLAEARRVLKPGGILIVTVPFLYGIHEEPHDFHRYTAYRLRSMLGGFSQVCIEPVAGAAVVVVDLVGKLLWRVPVLGGVLSRVFQAVAGRVAPRRLGRSRWPVAYAGWARA